MASAKPSSASSFPTGFAPRSFPSPNRMGRKRYRCASRGASCGEGPFKDLTSLNAYYKKYKKGRTSKKLKMDEITIFVIMDVDGDRLSAKTFRSGDLFKDSPFYGHIVPIMNDPNLDYIMRCAGYEVEGRKKPGSYSEVLEKVESIQEFCKSLEGLNTDLPVMIDAI